MFYFKILDEFSSKFPNARVPSKNQIRDIYLKTSEFGTVHNLNSANSPGDGHSGRRRSARSQAMVQAVKDVVAEDRDKAPDDPTVRSSRRNGILDPNGNHMTKSTFNRITKDLHIHPYKMQRVSNL